MTQIKLSVGSFNTHLSKSQSEEYRFTYIKKMVANGLDLSKPLLSKKFKLTIPALWYILSSEDEVGAKVFWKCVDEFNIDLFATDAASEIFNAVVVRGSRIKGFLNEWKRRGLPVTFEYGKSPLGVAAMSNSSGIEIAEELVKMGASFLEKHSNVAFDYGNKLEFTEPEMPAWLYVLYSGKVELIKLMLRELTISNNLNVFKNDIKNVVFDTKSGSQVTNMLSNGDDSSASDWFVCFISKNLGTSQDLLWNKVFPLLSEVEQEKVIAHIISEMQSGKELSVLLSRRGYDELIIRMKDPVFKDVLTVAASVTLQSILVRGSVLSMANVEAVKKFLEIVTFSGNNALLGFSEKEKEELRLKIIRNMPDDFEKYSFLFDSSLKLERALLNSIWSMDNSFINGQKNDITQHTAEKIVKFIKLLRSNKPFNDAETRQYIDGRTVAGLLSSYTIFNELFKAGLLERKSVLKKMTEFLDEGRFSMTAVPGMKDKFLKTKTFLEREILMRENISQKVLCKNTVL